MNCPGSVWLSKDMPGRSSEHAEEGTRAHSLAEAILTGGKGSGPVEMVEHVMVYVDHVEELADQAGAIKHIEVRVKVTDQVWGTADAIVWNPDTRTLYVRDLKYGAGVAVEVCGNLQLKIYALAALLTMGYPAKTVDVGIVQPRCPHADGPVRSISFDAIDLIDFNADLLWAIARVNEAKAKPAGALNPTEKGCRWCLAAPKCPAIKARAQELARITFAPGLPYDPLELARSLEFLPIIEGWITNTREFAYGEAEKGVEIPDHKLVEKRASRRWAREFGPNELAQATGLPATDVAEIKVKSPAAVEKLLPKAQRELLDQLTIKESSGHTLVHVSDKREAIRVDAKAAFA